MWFFLLRAGGDLRDLARDGALPLVVVLELQLAQHVVLVLVGRVHGRGARVLLGTKAVDHRRVQKARDVRRHDPGEHLLCRGLKADGLFLRLLFGKVLILQRQQAHGAHVHVHAVAKVGVDDKELGDLGPGRRDPKASP